MPYESVCHWYTPEDCSMERNHGGLVQIMEIIYHPFVQGSLDGTHFEGIKPHAYMLLVHVGGIA